MDNTIEGALAALAMLVPQCSNAGLALDRLADLMDENAHDAEPLNFYREVVAQARARVR